MFEAMENLKINKFGLVIVLFILGAFLWDLGERKMSIRQYQGEWVQYESRDYSQAPTFPDGFRFNYPAHWEITSYENGATKNGRELRVSLRHPDYFFTPTTALQIWWRRVDDNWSLEDTKEWYVKDVSFGVNRAELEQKQNRFRKVEIGKAKYPALIQTFERFQGENPVNEVVLIVAGDEAFVFSFITDNYDEEVAATFDRMQASLEIYR